MVGAFYLTTRLWPWSLYRLISHVYNDPGQRTYLESSRISNRNLSSKPIVSLIFWQSPDKCIFAACNHLVQIERANGSTEHVIPKGKAVGCSTELWTDQFGFVPCHSWTWCFNEGIVALMTTIKNNSEKDSAAFNVQHSPTCINQSSKSPSATYPLVQTPTSKRGSCFYLFLPWATDSWTCKNAWQLKWTCV